MQTLFNRIYHLKSRLGGLHHDVAWNLGRDMSVRHARGARILVYHGVCLHDHLRYSTMFVALKMFESHLRLYKKYFNLLTLDDFYQQRFHPDKYNLCLTFDDGFANNFKYVLPLLEQFGIPATFFITGIREAGYDILWNDVLRIAAEFGPPKLRFQDQDFTRNNDGAYVSVSNKRLVDLLRGTAFEERAGMMKQLDGYKQRADPDQWLQLTTEEIRKLSASPLATIGSHGYYHNDLAKLSIDEVKCELTRSKKFLENTTGKEIHALAFPYGSYTRPVLAEAKSLGFSQILATDFLNKDDKDDATLRERLTINPFISGINQAHANICGHYR